MKNNRGAFVVALGLGLSCTSVLAACGSSSSSSSSSSSGNKAAFCADDQKLDSVNANASTPSAVLALLKANQSTIDDLAKQAPPDIASDANTVVQATDKAISSGDVTGMTSSDVQTAGNNIDSYCGISSD
jgi:ABC-type oligopeptide transport system substrate-binding subunit